MPSHAAAQELILPSELNHKTVKQVLPLLKTQTAEPLRLNAKAVESFDSSALALLLLAKRLGYSLEGIPDALMDLADLHGIGKLFKAV
jgi:ABC-type transporter Mla MlaB component